MIARIVGTFVTLPLLAFVGCAGSDEGTDSVGPAELALTTPAAGIDACGGRKACEDAFVLRALFSSRTVVTDTFDLGPAGSVGRPPLVAEYTAQWLAMKDGQVSTSITTEPLGGGRARARVSLLVRHGDTESGCSFVFELRGDRIVESTIPGSCAG